MSETTPNPCPPLEEIAAFIDGRLESADRARIVAHVARCADCYAVLAGTMDFLEHGEGDDEAERPKPKTPRLVLVGQGQEGDEMPPTESLRPVPPKASRRPSRWGWMLRLAAAVVLGVGAGWLLYPVLRPQEPELSTDQLLAGTQLPGGLKPFGDTYRSAAPGTGSPWESDALVRLGANVLDLRIWARQGSPGVRANLASAVHFDLRQDLGDSAPTFDPKVFEASDPAVSPADLEQRAVALDRQIEDLLAEAGFSAEYHLGKWAEAGRLAAASGNTDHFAKGSASRDYLRWLTPQLDGGEAKVKIVEAAFTPIQEIAQLLESGALEPSDLEALENHFHTLLRSYEDPPS